MPRIRKGVTSVKRRIDTSDKYYKLGLNDFADPFPDVHGTLPEKMVYSALVNAGIRFYFLNDISFSDPTIDFFKEYQADFILPDAKIIIEVQGSYWHSKPTAIESDAYKFAVYESFGYRALAWWDYDIFTNLSNLMGDAGITTLLRTTVVGDRGYEMTPLKRTKVDTSKGIRTMNARKRKPYRNFAGTSRRKLKKVQSSYAVR